MLCIVAIVLCVAALMLIAELYDETRATRNGRTEVGASGSLVCNARS